MAHARQVAGAGPFDVIRITGRDEGRQLPARLSLRRGDDDDHSRPECPHVFTHKKLRLLSDS